MYTRQRKTAKNVLVVLMAVLVTVVVTNRQSKRIAVFQRGKPLFV